MTQMVAKKRVKYPHGPTGREYAPGDSFEALTERDAKALVIVGKAEYGTAANKTDLPSYEPVDAGRKTMDDTWQPKKDESVAPLSNRYQRRDMRATDGPTGEETSAPSSRRGRQPRRQTSDD